MSEHFILNDSLLSLGRIICETWSDEDRSRAVAFEIETPEFKKLFEICSQYHYFKKLELDKFEIMFISYLWHFVIELQEESFDVLTCLKPFYNDPERFLHLNQVIQLINHNIFFLEKEIPRRRRKLKREFNITPNDLINQLIQFQPEFMCMVVEGMTNQIVEGYSSNKEMLMDWFKYVELLEETAPRGLGSYDGGKSEHSKITELENQKIKIEQRTENTRESFPLTELVKKYDLNHEETILFVFTLKENIEFSYPSLNKLIKMISLDYFEMHDNKKYLFAESKLLTSNLLILRNERDCFGDSYTGYKVNKTILSKLLNIEAESEKLEIDDKKNHIPHYFELIEPSNGFNELILPQDFKNTLSNSIRQFSGDLQNTLQKWGLFGKSIDSTNNQSLLMLFYGKPGTGKTFAAHAVAKELNKEIFKTDITKVLNYWVGESEKNVKEVFRSYAAFCKAHPNPPILLLNEADQLLTKRIDNPDGSTGISYNAVQNLLLEAFENFSGLLIATTNLKSNLDPAFDRRFNLKLEFPMPDYHELLQLWKLHLPETIPGAESINIEQLSEMYQLSGGQIKIIVQNACVEAASRKKDLQKLLQTDLIKFCNMEAKRITRNQKLVGF